MKTFTFASLSALVLGASVVAGAAHPAPTVHHHMKRQQFPHGVDLSAMLADPSSYLSVVSTALAKHGHAQLYAEQWASATNDPKFQASLSHVLVEQFGTKTAHIALAQYTSAADDDLEDCSTTSTAVAAAAANTAGADVVNADVKSASSSGSSGSALQQVSNAVSSGASDVATPANMITFTLAALPAILLAVL